MGLLIIIGFFMKSTAALEDDELRQISETIPDRQHLFFLMD